MENRISGHTGLLALIGSPVGHSGSPAMYNYSFEKLGLDYVYVALDVKATLGGTDTDIIFVVEEGLMTLSDGIILALYSDPSGAKFTGYTCGGIQAGAQLIKN